MRWLHEQLHIWFIVWALSVKEKVKYVFWMDINYCSVQKFGVSKIYYFIFIFKKN